MSIWVNECGLLKSKDEESQCNGDGVEATKTRDKSMVLLHSALATLLFFTQDIKGNDFPKSKPHFSSP
jgi:hypothetical protein